MAGSRGWRRPIIASARSGERLHLEAAAEQVALLELPLGGVAADAGVGAQDRRRHDERGVELGVGVALQGDDRQAGPLDLAEQELAYGVERPLRGGGQLVRG